MSTPPEISRREAEVLDLVGQHLTNAEIAARLVISVRTVESHVSALLRKLGVPDRRALARLAAERPADGRSEPTTTLPTPLTSFVGRARERAELTELITKHRQVTAVGPGGIGKTRLALAVAAEAAAEFPDGVWFADLIPVTDPDLVATAVAAALGLGEQPGRSMDESVFAALADRKALLVLDNCEHVRDGVAPFLERLLATCDRLTVLTTSRARLMVPYERVYVVPPLSLDGEGDSEAVTLFVDRAAAMGWSPDPQVRDHITAVCERLDGIALAIELAAARYPMLGLDGIEAGLSDPLRMLTGGSRADDRHRSVRAALDWSHALLEPADRALLRRVSVFVSPFSVEAAAEVAGLEAGVVADGLARLCDQSLLSVTAATGQTRYRALETVRQYGMAQLAEANELETIRARHLDWCLAVAGGLSTEGPEWRACFDAVADDLRAALGWAANQDKQRAKAHRLAILLAQLTFARNLLGEAQQRFEQAAELSADPSDAATALRQAAAVAGCRMLGDDMFRLHRAAGEAARQAGDSAGAACDLATAVTTAYRFSGAFVRLPTGSEAGDLLDAARQLAGDDVAAAAAIAVAEAGLEAEVFGGLQTNPDNDAPRSLASARRAVELAERTGDPLVETVALDAYTAAQSWAGDTFGTAVTARRRVELLSGVSVSPASTHELVDALVSATETSLGAGDLKGARRWAEQLAEHPLLAEVGHQALRWLLVADALAGNVDEVLVGSARFLDAWQRNGKPTAPGLGPAAAAVAMVHGLRDDEPARAEWLAVVDRVRGPDGVTRPTGYIPIYDAMLLLHRGDAAAALELLAPEPDEVWSVVTWVWLHWYVALRAETAVLAGHPAAADRIVAARDLVDGNPVASAQVTRAQALLDGDLPQLLATEEAFEAAGCRYQAARTAVLAGGEHAARGEAAIATLGLAPMAPLPDRGRMRD